MSVKEKLGGLYVNVSKAGKKYMNGFITINGVKENIIIFRDTYKEKDNPDHEKKPDFIIYKKEKYEGA